jgi:hypothetical protein
MNRKALEQVRDLIGAEIRNGVFDPVKRFPSRFAPKLVIPVAIRAGRSLAADMNAWIDDKQQRKVRASRLRDYRSHLKNYIEKAPIGTLDPGSLDSHSSRLF